MPILVFRGFYFDQHSRLSDMGVPHPLGLETKWLDLEFSALNHNMTKPTCTTIFTRKKLRLIEHSSNHIVHKNLRPVNLHVCIHCGHQFATPPPPSIKKTCSGGK